MEPPFTPAAQRAFAEAAAWASRATSEELEAQALLLGLLAESECRAALALADHGIDLRAVLARWPELTRFPDRYPAWEQPDCPGPDPVQGTASRRFSPAVRDSLLAARQRLASYREPVVLATEHVLMGLAAAEHEVGDWLRQQGIDPNQLQGEIQRQYGYTLNRWPERGTPPLELPPDEAESPEGPEAGPQPVSAPPAATEPGAAERAATKPASDLPPAPLAGPLGSPQYGGPYPPRLAAGEQLGLLRVIDAAANRAREGLRVVEDYVRFLLDDRHLTGQLKQLRHELAATIARFPSGDRLAARETLADVGTAVSTDAERQRAGTAGVRAANFARLQEALRTLEEFGKILDHQAAVRFEQLRYRAYTLQRAVEITRGSLDRLARTRLYVLLDGRASLGEFADLARALVRAGVDAIQLRDKQLDDRRLLERARALREITAAGKVLFIMNDRPDLAVLAAADGVHVGQEDLAVKDARTIVGPRALVGISTHSIEQARQAVLDGADYLGVGPTFPSETKTFEQFPGPDLLRAVAGEIRLPAFAIGGITLENLPQVLQSGIGRIAVSGAVLDAGRPEAAARQLAQRVIAGK